MPHATWSGTLQLSLISVPVLLYSATSRRSRTSFHMLHECGRRVGQRLECPEHGLVDRDEIKRGYPVSKEKMVVFEDEDFEQIELPTDQTIEIEKFVERDSVDGMYHDKPYYLTVEEGKSNSEACAVICKAMQDEKVNGLGRVVMHGRERTVLLEPLEDMLGFKLTTLHFPDELREPEKVLEETGDIKAEKDEVDLTKKVIRDKKGEFRPEEMRDRYEENLAELVESKLKGKKFVAEKPAPGKVLDFHDALKKSAEGTGKKKTGSKSRSKKGGSSSSKSSSSKSSSGKSSSKSGRKSG